ncbi:hypothetical protein Pelo_15325 [Pelomyxa schiedti]|nr:hypothetical protein Pelo_15325 [Pelomyxa schiedti]
MFPLVGRVCRSLLRHYHKTDAVLKFALREGTEPKQINLARPEGCLTTFKLFAFMFVACIVDAYGMEEAVRGVGPLFICVLVLLASLDFTATNWPYDRGTIKHTSKQHRSRNADCAVSPTMFIDYVSKLIPHSPAYKL